MWWFPILKVLLENPFTVVGFVAEDQLAYSYAVKATCIWRSVWYVSHLWFRIKYQRKTFGFPIQIPD